MIDHGVVPRSDTATVNVVIEDENDNEPIFTERFYQATVSESAKEGNRKIYSGIDKKLLLCSQIVFNLFLEVG